MDVPARTFALILVAILCNACDPAEGQGVAAATEQVVYGTDDRVEVFAQQDAALRAVAEDSVVALIPTFRIRREDDTATYSIITDTLAESKGLCPGELFGNQPSAAVCSGVLIERDLVLTAGHCVPDDDVCEQFALVFDYLLVGEGQLAQINDEDVYTCARVVVRESTGGGDLTPDFAIVQLDRPVEGSHEPVEVRSGSAPLAQDEQVTMIGFGSGLPAKIDTGGSVAAPRADRLDYFVANTDAFAGHSGSATLDSSNQLAGILVAGRDPDYESSPSQQCNIVNTFSDDEAGEAVHYVASIVEALCDSGWPSPSLCGPTECTQEPCPPDSWTCNLSWFAAGDACDCSCGTYDPDCDNDALPVGGCGDEGALCSLDGECEAKANGGSGSSSGCAVSLPSQPVRGPSMWWLLVVAALLWRRR